MAFKNMGIYKTTRENERDESYAINSQMQVDSATGQFRFRIDDDEIYKILKGMKAVLSSPRMGTKEKYSYLYGDTMPIVKGLLLDAVDNHLKCEIERSIVIIYSFAHNMMYYKHHDGKIFNNASDDENYNSDDKENKGEWVGSRCSISDPMGSQNVGNGLKVYATVLEQTRYIRPLGTSAKYSHYCHRETRNDGSSFGEHIVELEYAEELAAICNDGVIRDLNSCHETDITNEPYTLNIIPYTEESAKFFITMLMGMYNLVDKFNMFFAQDEKEIVEYMKNNQKILEMK